MFKFALDGITSFSTVPLRLASWLGYAASLFAFALPPPAGAVPLRSGALPLRSGALARALYRGAFVLAAVAALGMLLARYHLLYSNWGVVAGPGWTDDHVRLPAYGAVV